MFYPMKLHPCFKDYIWGGRRLVNEYGKQSDLDTVAESWELSCHKNGMSRIANGEFAGKTLEEFILMNRAQNIDVIGSNTGENAKFPLLIKWIDASQKLSVQVHPDDNYAQCHESGELGKTEMWYIADAKKDAHLIYGFNREITKEEFKKAIEEGTLEAELRYVPVKKGDCFFIEAGLVHAICEGILIVEIQQNSDTTYRVYDWGRVDENGEGRPLHIQKALEVSKLCRASDDMFAPPKGADIIGGKRTVLKECPYFKVYKYEIEDKMAFFASKESFHSLTVLEGDGQICMDSAAEFMKKGNSFFIPAGAGEYQIKGTCTLLLTQI